MEFVVDPNEYQMLSYHALEMHPVCENLQSHCYHQNSGWVEVGKVGGVVHQGWIG